MALRVASTRRRDFRWRSAPSCGSTVSSLCYRHSFSEQDGDSRGKRAAVQRVFSDRSAAARNVDSHGVNDPGAGGGAMRRSSTRGRSRHDYVSWDSSRSFSGAAQIAARSPIARGESSIGMHLQSLTRRAADVCPRTIPSKAAAAGGQPPVHSGRPLRVPRAECQATPTREVSWRY